MVRTQWVVAACMLGLVACDSGRTGGVKQAYGEIGLVWRDRSNLEVVNREASFEFGQVTMGERRTRKLVIRNLNSGRLTLVSLDKTEGSDVAVGDPPAAGSPFEIRFSPGSLMAAEEMELEIAFTPPQAKDATVAEETHRALLVLHADGTRPEEDTATILLEGRGKAGVCLVPKALDFGKVTRGERGTLDVTLKNEGLEDTNATIGEPAADDGVPLAFTNAPATPAGPLPLSVGEAKKVGFTFAPTELRAYSAVVELRMRPECPTGKMHLTGVGTDEAFGSSPATLEFGYIHPGTRGLRTLTLVNPSRVPVKLTQISVSPPGDISVVPAAGQDPTKLDLPEGSTPLTVQCLPTSFGPRDATLTFQTDLVLRPSVSVPVHCYGGGPNLTVTPRPTLSFGRVGFFPGTTGATVERTLKMTNTGSRPPGVIGPQVNLHLGLAGEAPYFTMKPLNASTMPSEISVTFPSGYDTVNGLEAGQSVVLGVALTPETVGTKEVELTLYSNDPDEPVLVITITADVQQLPPCSFAVLPPKLDFGLLTPPSFQELPVTIRNTGAQVCYFGGFDITPDSDAAYSIIGEQQVSTELQPGERTTVIVRSWPRGQVPASVTSAKGTLRFWASSPTTPKVEVPLETSVGPACLVTTPDFIDFGRVKPGCRSAVRTFRVYNTCPNSVMVNSIGVSVGAGQPAGGPDCAGALACPEFFLVSSPPISSAGLELRPASAPLEFQARYEPIDLGDDSGALSITGVQDGKPVTYLVSLQGTGDASGLQTDKFQQQLKPKADLLLVVDNSGSMADKQLSLGSNFDAFIKYATTAKVDWQMGVTTTDDEGPVPGSNGNPGKPDGEHGRLMSTTDNPAVLTPNTPDVATLFKEKVKVGVLGSGTEQPLSCALKAVTAPLVTGDNTGFLRPEAHLAIVVVSDAAEQSPGALSYYEDRLLNIKGFNRANDFSFNIIGPFVPVNVSSTCPYDNTSPDDGRYADLVTDTGGVKAEICTTDWASSLEGLGKTAFGFRTRFFLSQQPDLNGTPLQVKIAGKVIAQTSTGNTVWIYDQVANAVEFAADKAPGPGQVLEITYPVACL